MTTRVVHVVQCEMPNCTSEFTPFGGLTAKDARAAAKADDWRRIFIAAGPGSPAHWCDVCPNHGSEAL